MDITTENKRAFRRDRLRCLIDTYFGGVQTAFANKADIAESLVSRYLRDKKGIGEDTVRKIEENTGYFGWFDMGGKRDAAAQKRHARKNVQRLCDLAERMSDPGLELIIEYMQMMTRRYPLKKDQKRKAA